MPLDGTASRKRAPLMRQAARQVQRARELSNRHETLFTSLHVTQQHHSRPRVHARR